MRAAVPGAALPEADTVPAWAAFATAEAAGRVIANQRNDDALAVIEACERREGEIAKAVRR